MCRVVVVEQLHGVVLRGVAKAPYGIVAHEFRMPVVGVDLGLGPEVAGNVSHRIARVDDGKELVVVEGESAPLR